jgi:hypothetical protein
MARKTTAKKRAPVALPAGFKAITAGGDYAPSWEFERTPVIEGVLKSVRVWRKPKKGKEPARDVRIATVATKNGDLSVWESAGLRALFTVKKGKRVALVYKGKRRIKGRTQPMRDFQVGVA